MEVSWGHSSHYHMGETREPQTLHSNTSLTALYVCVPLHFMYECGYIYYKSAMSGLVLQQLVDLSISRWKEAANYFDN